MTYQVAHLDDLDRLPVEHGLEWRFIRRRFGIRAFGVNAYTAEKPGDWVVEEHTEETYGHEELYVVVRGRARFTLDGEEVDAPAGTLLFISDPAVKRVAIAEDEGTTVLAVGGKAGESFEPSAWEWQFVAATQPTEQAIETLTEGLAELGDKGSLYFNLARRELQARRVADAKAHLARAIELRPELAALAQSDDDLRAL